MPATGVAPDPLPISLVSLPGLTSHPSPLTPLPGMDKSAADTCIVSRPPPIRAWRPGSTPSSVECGDQPGMATTDIVIRGAREHNLRDVSLDLPRGQLICFTGVSGSGKSSLAFDTLYAEGQRRYVESLSSYARQFLGQMPKPEVDRIDGLSPSISIQQKTGGRNPRSTVGTITEINDYLRVLFARVGQGHCPKCDRPVAAQTREQIVARVLDLPAGTAYSVLAPVDPGAEGGIQGPLRRPGPRRVRAGQGQRAGRPADGQAGARPPDQAQHRGGDRPPEGGAGDPRRGWPRRSRRP